MTEKLTLKKKAKSNQYTFEAFSQILEEKMALREDALCWRDSKLVCAHHVRMKT